MPKTKLAKVSLTPKGAWDSATAYEQLDLVSYDGGSWVAKKPSTGVTPRENDCWMQAAEKGEKGDNAASSESATYLKPRNTGSFLDPGIQTACPWGNGFKLAWIPADNIVVEETTDGGETWTVQTCTDTRKENLFRPYNDHYSGVSIPLINGMQNSLCGIRINFTGAIFNVPDGTTDAERMSYWTADNFKTNERYVGINGLIFWSVTSGGYAITCKTEAKSLSSDTWKKISLESDTLQGNTGVSFVSLSSDASQTTFGGYSNNNNSNWIWRITCFTSASSSKTSSQEIYNILGVGSSVWKYPSSKIQVAYGVPYAVDSSRRVSFDGGGTFRGTLYAEGAQIYAEKPFKLIETITFTEDAALERTAAPDGTAYKFREVYLKISRADGTTGMDTIGYRAANGSKNLAHTYGSMNAGMLYSAVHFYAKNGMWFGERYGGSSDAFAYTETRNGGSSWLLRNSTSSYPAITRLYSYMSNIPAGTTIEIWAVEA